MSIREDLKSILAKENITLTKLAEMSTQKGHKITKHGLSQKLLRGTIKYEEAKFLIELLGYKVKIEKNTASF